MAWRSVSGPVVRALGRADILSQRGIAMNPATVTHFFLTDGLCELLPGVRCLITPLDDVRKRVRREER
jgi:hypothetical protein